MEFRSATRDDAWAIAEFQTVCWREAYVGLVPQSYLDAHTAADRQHRWSRRIFDDQRTVILAESAGSIVGVACLGLRDGGRELMSLYVAAENRGTGLAQRMLDDTVGTDPARLWVFEGNERAIRFYERNGFAVDGETMPDPDTGLAITRMTRGQASSTSTG